MMQLTSGIESCFARWTLLRVGEVRFDRMLSATGSAQYGLLLPARPGPGDRRMTGAFLVTFETGIIAIATGELDGQDVEDGMVVLTSCEAVYGFAINQGAAYRYEPSQGWRF